MNKQTKKRPSLQALLQQRQHTEFVGRAEQLAFFRTNLELALEDRRRKFVINVFGQGGVGKTTLLGQFRRIAEEMEYGVALTDENEDEVPEVIGRWAADLKKQGFVFKAFEERYKVYRQKREELEADPQAPQGFAAFAARTATKVALHTVKHTVPGSGLVLDLVDAEAVSSQAGEWAEFIRKRLGNKDEVRLILEPEEVLTPLFLAGLQAEEKSAVLICDTYEHTSIFLDGWLRGVLDGRYGEVPGDLLLIIGGRDEVARNAWAAYLQAIAHISLEPFSEQEARDYLVQQGITNEPVIEVILKLSGLLPVLLATLAAESPDDPGQIGDASGTAVERFLTWVDDPVRRALAINAALPRHFNKDIVRVLVENGADTLFTWLSMMPFVKELPGATGWAYHEIVREQMILYKRRESPEEWSSIHEKLVSYWQDFSGAMELTDTEGIKDEHWQLGMLESLYHRLCRRPQQERLVALNGFLDWLEGQRAFARRWAEVMYQVGRDTEDEQLQIIGIRLEEGLRAHERGEYTTTINMFSYLLGSTQVSPMRRAILFASRGDSYRWMSQHNLALADYHHAIELDPGNAQRLIDRGYAYQQMNRHDLALADFTHAIELEPNNWYMFTERGRAYQQMNQHDLALADFTRAIELEPNNWYMFTERGRAYQQMNQHDLALADFTHAIELEPNARFVFTERGRAYQQMNQHDLALADFTRAIELDEKYAWAIASRGETYRLMAQYEPALADFNRAIELNENDAWAIARRGETYRLMAQYEPALADFNRAIELDENMDWAIASRGETYRLMAQYEPALADFNRAIELNENDAWAIASRGETYRLMAQYEPAQADFNRAIELDENMDWAIASRGVTYRLMAQYEPALADFNRAIELNENDAWAIASRGETYRLMAQYEPALTDFNRAIELDENYAWAIASRGVTYRLMAQYEPALADFNRAIEPDASDWDYYQRGLTYLITLERSKAKADFSAAIHQAETAYQEKPQDWRNTFNLAIYYLAEEQNERAEKLYQEGLDNNAPDGIVREAINDLEEYLALFPNHEPAQEMKARLQAHLDNRKG